MSLALSKGTCGRTFGMANQSGGRAILAEKGPRDAIIGGQDR